MVADVTEILDLQGVSVLLRGDSAIAIGSRVIKAFLAHYGAARQECTDEQGDQTVADYPRRFGR
jgi:hypothetical protein